MAQHNIQNQLPSMNSKNNQFELGIVPPQDIKIERMVLSAILRDKRCQNLAFSIIKNTDVFYVESHILIFEAIKNLFEDNKSISTQIVFIELKRLRHIERIGGIQYLTDLAVEGTDTDSIEMYIRILQEMWMRRVLLFASYQNIKNAVDESIDVFDLLESHQKDLLRINNELSIKKAQKGKDIVKKSLDEIQTAMNAGGLSGLPSTWSEWDNKLGGFKGNNLIVIAGRPGMGKTALVLAIMKNLVFQDKAGLFFSLEMSATQLMKRLISSEVTIPYSRIENGRIDESDLQKIHLKGVHRFITDNIEIDDTTAISIQELKAKATIKKQTSGLDFIIVDYLQLMKGKGGNREQEISSLSAGLKNIAKELDIPVFALAQLSRAVESRADKRPNLADLRESGAIEQDADVVIFPFRPSYYGLNEPIDGMPAEFVIINIIAKNRGGGTFDLVNYCDIKCNQIEDRNFNQIKEISSRNYSEPLHENNPDNFNWGNKDENVF